MPKYVFTPVCSEDKVGDSSLYKRIKFQEQNDPTKIIEFCGPHIGAYSIRDYNGQKSFRMFVEGARYNFRGVDFCDSWMDGKFYDNVSVSLSEVKLRVIFDEDFEYKIAIFTRDNGWVTLPKSSLFGENLDPERYYNKELTLSEGQALSRHQSQNQYDNYYIPKVMYGETEVCKLAPFGFLYCSGGSVKIADLYGDFPAGDYKIVVEKDGGGELSIYFADQDGKPKDVNHSFALDVKNYVNSSLKTVLLENSNIRKVLPELEIDDGVHLERKLKSLVAKVRDADLVQVAQELVTNKADELGRAVLEAKNGDRRILVSDPILQEGVAEKLRENPGNTKGPKGEKGNPGAKGEKGDPGEKGDTGEKGEKGNTGEQGPPGNDGSQGLQGPRGEDASSSEIVNRLKHDSRFKREVRGEKGDTGEQGPPGNDGQPGPQGLKGEDANPAEVAREWADDSTKRSKISREIMDNDKFQEAVKYLLKKDTGFKGGVGSILKSDEGFRDSVKGDPGEKGLPGNDGQPGAQGPKGKDANSSEIVNRIKHDSRFKREVRGEKGDAGEQGLEGRPGNDGQPGQQGQPGKDGESPPAKDVAAQLLTDGNKDTLATEIASNEGLQKAVADNQNLKTAVTTDLKGDGDFQAIIKGERGERGPQGDPGNDVSIKHRFTLQKGEKLSEDIYEANIVLNGKTMAVLPKIGYYMLGDRLVMRNHVTKEEVAIPRDFHYLKVVKLGSGFDSDDYKLTFCNVLGNQFFEYKKYDPQYSNISDEYKFISLSCAKKEYDLNLSELLSYQPLFFITEGSAELDLGKHSADVFELTHAGKGRKMATLIDEFGYFDQNGMFMHCNYHEETKYRSYNSAEIDKEYKITDADSEFYLDNIILHTTPELSSI